MDKGDLSQYALTIPESDRMNPCALLGEQDFVRLAREIGEGLDCLHFKLEYTHGDMKPCNNGVDSTLGFQIIDFEDCAGGAARLSNKYISDLRRFQCLIQYCLAAHTQHNIANKYGYIHPSGLRVINEGALAPYYSVRLVQFVFNFDWSKANKTCAALAAKTIKLLGEP